MIAESKQQEIKQAALELVQAESAYNKAKARFEILLNGIQGGAKAVTKSPELPLRQDNATEPGTVRFMNALPADGTPVATNQLSVLLGKDSRWISATGSSLVKRGKIEKVQAGMWRNKSQQ